MEGTECDSSDKDEIILHTNSAGVKLNEKEKQPEKYRILTRSRALVDAIEDEDSSDEERNEVFMVVEEALMGDLTSFNEAYYH
jgi:hypothetical protein